MAVGVIEAANSLARTILNNLARPDAVSEESRPHDGANCVP